MKTDSPNTTLNHTHLLFLKLCNVIPSKRLVNSLLKITNTLNPKFLCKTLRHRKKYEQDTTYIKTPQETPVNILKNTNHWPLEHSVSFTLCDRQQFLPKQVNKINNPNKEELITREQQLCNELKNIINQSVFEKKEQKNSNSSILTIDSVIGNSSLNKVTKGSLTTFITIQYITTDL